MPNIRLVIEYDGSAFHGWQAQPEQRTVEQELRKALRTLLREDVSALYAAGRTDSGVHARGQVVNFHAEKLPDLSRLTRSISSLMRRELSVVSADVVPDDFHARKSAVSKQYVYTIFRRLSPPVLDRGRVWYVGGALDVDCMRREAAILAGVHDFTSLCAADGDAASPVREIFESEISLNAPYLVYRVTGNGFLKQMVRNIVGTLVQLGKGMLELKSMQEILAARDRRSAGMTAPAHGLCLEWVKYSL